MDQIDTFLIDTQNELEEKELVRGQRSTVMKKLEKKRASVIDNFIGSNHRVKKSVIFPRYYADVLTWAAHSVLEEEKWKVVATLGYDYPDAEFFNITPDYSKKVNLVGNGRLLVQKGKIRLVITIDINFIGPSRMVVEGSHSKEKLIESMATKITNFGRKNNFFRFKRFEFGSRLRLIDIKDKTWDTVIIDDDIKNDIRANTVDFLAKSKIWEKYGIAAKRGILLAGEPGTGKTIVCKALMSEVRRITCIITSAYNLRDTDYLSELYEIAEDLKPSLVFIEDIDLIGQDRDGALVSLLAILDGVEENKEIVTIATTNYLETLDKALSERPSRFDRVIKLTRPSLNERVRLIHSQCLRIPISEETQGYIAGKSAGCTPAQIQEIVHSLVIDRIQKEGSDCKKLNLGKPEVDKAIARISGMNRNPIGFCSGERA